MNRKRTRITATATGSAILTTAFTLAGVSPWIIITLGALTLIQAAAAVALWRDHA